MINATARLESIPTLAREFGRGDITAIFYFVETYSLPKPTFEDGDFRGYEKTDVIRCVKVRHADRKSIATMLKKFRRVRNYLRNNDYDLNQAEEYNMIWLASRWTICYLHDDKHHKRYTFKPKDADETPWWILP